MQSCVLKPEAAKIRKFETSANEFSLKAIEMHVLFVLLLIVEVATTTI